MCVYVCVHICIHIYIYIYVWPYYPYNMAAHRARQSFGGSVIFLGLRVVWARLHARATIKGVAEGHAMCVCICISIYIYVYMRNMYRDMQACMYGAALTSAPPPPHGLGFRF